MTKQKVQLDRVKSTHSGRKHRRSILMTSPEQFTTLKSFDVWKGMDKEIYTYSRRLKFDTTLIRAFLQ